MTDHNELKRQWRAEDSIKDCFLPKQDYPLANILGPSQNRAHRRISLITWLSIVTAVLYAVFYLLY
jgi:hypothetical protein